MTPAELADWQKRLRLTGPEAARALGIAPRTLHNQRSGATPVTLQTELLCHYVELFDPNWLNIAEIATRLARTVPRRRLN